MWAGQNDRDCFVCAGVLSYVSPGVRQSLTARGIVIIVFGYTGREVLRAAATLDLELVAV